MIIKNKLNKYNNIFIDLMLNNQHEFDKSDYVIVINTRILLLKSLPIYFDGKENYS